jgi:serine/threonine protein kinase
MVNLNFLSEPANILLAADEHKPSVKIADFGFAKRAITSQDGSGAISPRTPYKQVQRNNTELGTLGYAAPEIFGAGGSYDEKVDIWAIGIIVHIMLCGYPPFCEIDRDEETNKLLVGFKPFWKYFEKFSLPSFEELKGNDRILTFDEDAWSGISEAARDFCSSCLQLNPANRPSTRAALQHPWFFKDLGVSKLPHERIAALEKKLKLRTTA